ncbi:MAG: molybdate ABC transporter substrate-binding protein [Clostridia bacterium]|jgi:molybdate transport system substrate-binding protein|nr:molybdate ABC transporter substrate-binding protein [Clostridia bacterium]MDH7572319.1 molybdate ABC transporter substrate-binding protein [Clostridia bacterium]
MAKLAVVWAGLLLVATVLSGCSRPAEPGALTVAAGAGLSEVLPVVGEDFQKAYPKVKVTFTFASGGAIAAQVRQGAPVDAVVFPSGGGHLDALEQEGLILAGSRRLVAEDDLVLAVPTGVELPPDPWSWLAGTEVRRVAIGEPKAVPAGTYALQTLRHLGLAEAVRPKLVYARTVRQALVYVEQGEAEAALVYRSTLHGAERARLAAVAPAQAHDPIRFEAAVVSATRKAEEARLFLDYLSSPDAARVLEAYGLRAAGSAPRAASGGTQP